MGTTPYKYYNDRKYFVDIEDTVICNCIWICVNASGFIFLIGTWCSSYSYYFYFYFTKCKDRFHVTFMTTSSVMQSRSVPLRVDLSVEKSDVGIARCHINYVDLLTAFRTLKIFATILNCVFLYKDTVAKPYIFQLSVSTPHRWSAICFVLHLFLHKQGL